MPGSWAPYQSFMLLGAILYLRYTFSAHTSWDPTCHHSPGHWQARVEGGSCQRGPGIASLVNAPVGTVQRKGCKGTGEMTKKPAARETGEDGVSRQGRGLLEVEWTGCTISTAVSQEPPQRLILVMLRLSWVTLGRLTPMGLIPLHCLTQLRSKGDRGPALACHNNKLPGSGRLWASTVAVAVAVTFPLVICSADIAAHTRDKLICFTSTV